MDRDAKIFCFVNCVESRAVDGVVSCDDVLFLVGDSQNFTFGRVERHKPFALPLLEVG